MIQGTNALTLAPRQQKQKQEKTIQLILKFFHRAEKEAQEANTPIRHLMIRSLEQIALHNPKILKIITIAEKKKSPALKTICKILPKDYQTAFLPKDLITPKRVNEEKEGPKALHTPE